MASTKRAKRGAAEAAPFGAKPEHVLAVTLVVGFVPHHLGGFSVDLGLGIGGPEDLAAEVYAAEPLLRPHMLAFRDAVLSALGAPGPFPETYITTVEGAPEPATAQPAPFVKQDSRGGRA